jgi:ferritin-like metal-binding protein YciE
MAKEGEALLKKADDSLADAIVLAAAVESEHHEIAVYETLIINARARGASEVADLLQLNLEQEHNALDIARSSMETAAREGIAVGTGS